MLSQSYQAVESAILCNRCGESIDSPGNAMTDDVWRLVKEHTVAHAMQDATEGDLSLYVEFPVVYDAATLP